MQVILIMTAIKFKTTVVKLRLGLKSSICFQRFHFLQFLSQITIIITTRTESAIYYALKFQRMRVGYIVVIQKEAAFLILVFIPLIPHVELTGIFILKELRLIIIIL